MGILDGKVINHSDLELWVIETTTNHPHGPPIAHRLSGKRKSPRGIDADGFRRCDGRSIDGHEGWWKILDLSNADIYPNGDDLKICIAYKKKVPDLHFGAYVVDNSANWGEPLKLVTAIYKTKSRRVVGYEVHGVGYVDKQTALSMAESGELDNIVLVKRGASKYLRSKPDQINSNNFSEVVIV